MPNEIPARARKAVRARSGGRCEFVYYPTDSAAPVVGDLRCRNTATEVHHRLPRRHKNHEPSNLLHVCSVHHDWIEDNRAEARHRGLILVPAPYDPLTKFDAYRAAQAAGSLGGDAA